MVFVLHKSGQDVWIFMTSAFVGLFSVQCYADISVYNVHGNQQIDGGYRSFASKFGSPLDPEGFEGFVTYNSSDGYGCNSTNIIPPPMNVHYGRRWILLVKRGNCTFVEKVRNAQIKQYDMVIVFNNASDVEPMHGRDASDILIPSVFVSLNTGLKLKNKYQYFEDVYVLVEDDSNFPFDINADLLIPFAVVVAVCFITMISFMICKCIRDRRRARRHRLPASSLRKIPIEKFSSKTSPFETCAICLDDYVDGEKLRVLPCCHAYHTKCIDPWLTRNRRVCPICKRKVFAADEMPIEGSESDSDTDNDERTPLVRSETSQQRQQPRRSYLLSPESIFSPISRFAWQYQQPNGDSAAAVAGSSYGSSRSETVIESENRILPASTVCSINSVDEDFPSSASNISYNYPGTSSLCVQIHEECDECEDVLQTSNNEVYS